MPYKQNIDYCFGAGRLKESDVKQLNREAAEGLGKVLDDVAAHRLPILSIASQTNDLPEIESLAGKIKSNFDNLVVLGTGGSSLCGHALSGYMTGEFSARKPRVIFLQNIDPFTVDELFLSIDISRTAFLAISKSGVSIETLTQLSVCLERAKNHDVAARFYIVTMPGDNPLRRIAAKLGIAVFDHDPNIGGRFSILSNVGLIPAIVSGMDVRKLRSGADHFLNNMAGEAAISAAIHVALMRRNIWQNVLMTYPDRLEHLNIWYRQIWAESTGKNGTGSTPIKSLGTIDQHSQMQNYLGGRKDKFYNFITEDFAGLGDKLVSYDTESDYLSTHSLGDVISAEPLYIILSVLGHPDAHEKVRVLSMRACEERVSLYDMMNCDAELAPYRERMTARQREMLQNHLKYNGYAPDITRDIVARWEKKI